MLMNFTQKMYKIKDLYNFQFRETWICHALNHVLKIKDIEAQNEAIRNEEEDPVVVNEKMTRIKVIN